MLYIAFTSHIERCHSYSLVPLWSLGRCLVLLLGLVNASSLLMDLIFAEMMIGWLGTAPTSGQHEMWTSDSILPALLDVVTVH